MGIGLRVEGLVGKIWARCQIRFSQDAGGGGFKRHRTTEVRAYEREGGRSPCDRGSEGVVIRQEGLRKSRGEERKGGRAMCGIRLRSSRLLEFRPFFRVEAPSRLTYLLLTAVLDAFLNV
jgi:hypothetical protein